jgi:WD40 repeat protein
VKTFLIAALVLLLRNFAGPQEIVATTLEETWGSSLYMKISGTLHRVYQDADQVLRNADIKSSPNGELVGAISNAKNLQSDALGRMYYHSRLMIFDSEGVRVFQISNVIRFSWSPNGKFVAYVEARGNGESYRIIPRTLKVIDVQSHKVNTLFQAAFEDLAWPSFDSMIYYTDYRKVYRVNPWNGMRDATTYKGVYFSPDGHYYFSANYEGGGFAVYERITYRDVTPDGYRGNPAVNFHRWVGEGSTLVFGDYHRDKQVYDMDRKQSKGTISGQVLAYDKSTGEFTVMKQHRYFPTVSDKKIETVRVPQ